MYVTTTTTTIQSGDPMGLTNFPVMTTSLVHIFTGIPSVKTFSCTRPIKPESGTGLIKNLKLVGGYFRILP